MYVLSICAFLCLFSTMVYGRSSAVRQRTKQLMCSNDEEIKSSVVECLNLLPDSFPEILESCNSELNGDKDYTKWISLYCSRTDRQNKQSQDCVFKKYRERKESPVSAVMPVVNCMKDISIPSSRSSSRGK